MNPDNLQVNETLDATGLTCPEPIMLLHNKIRDIQAGNLLKIIATDPSTQRDIPKFCNFLNHQLVSQQENDGTYYYWIRKKED